MIHVSGWSSLCVISGESRQGLEGRRSYRSRSEAVWVGRWATDTPSRGKVSRNNHTSLSTGSHQSWTSCSASWQPSAARRRRAWARPDSAWCPGAPRLNFGLRCWFCSGAPVLLTAETWPLFLRTGNCSRSGSGLSGAFRWSCAPHRTAPRRATEGLLLTAGAHTHSYINIPENTRPSLSTSLYLSPARSVCVRARPFTHQRRQTPNWNDILFGAWFDY